MPNADETTVKIPAYSGKAQRPAPQNNLTEAQNNALELANKSRQLEEEKKKSLDHLNTIEQLQESVRQEQAKTAEMAKKIAQLEAKVRELAMLESKAKELVLLEAKVKELNEVLGKISGIAAAGKAG